MPKLLETIFIQLFNAVYPLLHTHLASYTLLLALGLGLCWLIWKAIRRLNRSRYLGAAFLKYLLGAGLVFLIAFLLWFVLFYFHTFLSQPLA